MANEWADFLDRLVHDLREPLRSVHAFSELLNETTRDQFGLDGEEALREVLSGTSRMRTLIDGLSGYAMCLRESDEAPGSSASLQLAFELALDELNREIHTTEATVTGEALPRVGIGLESLTRVLKNLIANALRFRGEPRPVVHVSAHAEAGGWRVEVADNGIGIEAADCEIVFQPFARINGRKYAGAGLGLSVCRKIVSAHGGWIRMSPGLNGGAVCAIWLPSADAR